MADLRDFEVGAASATLEEFVPEPTPVVVNSEATNKNTAAHIAMIGEGNPEENYRNTLGALNTGEDVTGMKGPLAGRLKNELDQSKESLMNVLADPTVSDGEKLKISENFTNSFMKMTTPRNLVSSVTATLPKADESKETELVTVDIGETIQKVNGYKDGVQAIVNASSAQNNPDVVESIGNFMDLVIPLTEGAMTAQIARDMKAGDSSFLYNTALMGEARNDIVNALRKLPIDQKMEAVQQLVDIVNKHDDMILTDDNQLARTAFLADVLETGDTYGIEDRIIDNAISLLDATIIGGSVVKLFKGSKQAIAISSAIKSAVRSDVKPASLSRNVKDTNPEVARQLDEAVTNDATGEAAEAIAGTTRTEAIADGRLAEVADDAGTVDNKVSLGVNDDVRSFVNEEGAIFYADTEKVSMRAKAVEQVSRDEMFTVGTIEDLPDGVAIRGIYGMRDSGYLDPQEALNLTEYAMRDMGIERNQLSLLKLDDTGQRVLVDNKTTEAGDYLVGVDYRYKFNPLDNTNYYKADVKRNFFDRLNLGITSGKSGTFQRYILDAASMLNPLLTKGANVAVDRTFGLERILSDQGKIFSKAFAKVPMERRLALEGEIKRANQEGIDLNYNKLMGDGFSEGEVRILKDWREMWDTVYWLENRDLAKNLRNQGFSSMVDKIHDTQIFAKPIKQRHAVKDGVKVYDYAKEEIRVVGKTELDWLYETGGVVAKMKSKKVVGEDVAEFVISSEQKGGGYLRAITDSDQVLNYRKGYYQVQYKAPKFVEKLVSKLKKDGTPGDVLYRGAVATADNTKDAHLTASRMRTSVDADEVNHVEFLVRGDVKGNPLDDSYDLAFSRGRTAQRTRGERLHDGSGSGIASASDNHILDPVEALTKSIRSVSRRTQMREYIDATKARFMKQYDGVLQSDGQGRKVFPSDRKQIGTPEHSADKIAADARTTWEYINYLESGYVNSIADSYKGLLNMIADTAGNYSVTAKGVIGKGAQKVEEGLRKVGGMRSPDDIARAAAFKLYLALNPARQYVVQSHQAIRLNYVNPVYMSTRAAPEMSVLVAGLYDVKVMKPLLKLSGHTEASAKQLVKDFRRSGLNSAVDANNLVRADLQKLADLTQWERAKGVLNAPVKGAQKLGFDAGEETHIMLTWLAMRDKAIKAGTKMDSAGLDEVGAQARNFSYNMNAAGDMAYNRNIFSMIMQFAQIPHKALMANSTNRIIPPAVRAKSATGDLLLFGLGSGSIGLMVSSLIPDDQPDIKQTVQRGLEEIVLNKAITTIYGEDTEIDFSTLAPTDISGFANLFYEMWTQSPGTTVANSPAGQLFFGGNPRVTNLINDAMSYFGLGPKVDVENEVDFDNVMRSAARVASGTSNALKAYLALESGQRVNSRGQVIDSDVNTAEAVAQLFGLGTITAAQNYAVSRQLYEESKAFEEDGKLIFNDQMRRYSDQGLTAKEIVSLNKGYGMAWQAWGVETPRGRQVIQKLLKQSLRDPGSSLYMSLRKSMSFMDPNDLRELIHASSIPQDNKDVLFRMLDDAQDIENYKGGE